MTHGSLASSGLLKGMPLPFSPNSQRLLSIALVVIVLLCDGAAMLLSRTTYQTLVSGLTLVALAATAGALVNLITSKGDWPVRGPLLLLVFSYTAYKVYVFVDFLRNG